jgi:hypothetical protein
MEFLRSFYQISNNTGNALATACSKHSWFHGKFSFVSIAQENPPLYEYSVLSIDAPDKQRTTFIPRWAVANSISKCYLGGWTHFCCLQFHLRLSTSGCCTSTCDLWSKGNYLIEAEIAHLMLPSGLALGGHQVLLSDEHVSLSRDILSELTPYGIPNVTVWRMLRKPVHLKAYKPTDVQHLERWIVCVLLSVNFS